jgi:hypothetical protein
MDHIATKSTAHSMYQSAKSKVSSKKLQAVHAKMHPDSLVQRLKPH